MRGCLMIPTARALHIISAHMICVCVFVCVCVYIYIYI